MSCQFVKVSLFWYPAGQSLVSKQKKHRDCATNLAGELTALPYPTLLSFFGPTGIKALALRLVLLCTSALQP